MPKPTTINVQQKDIDRLTKSLQDSAEMLKEKEIIIQNQENTGLTVI